MKPPYEDKRLCIDTCLVQEIAELRSIGIRTTGCCCGHNKQQGYIGVEPQFIDKMKSLGYVVHFNKSRPGDEDSFVPMKSPQEKYRPGRSIYSNNSNYLP